MGKRTYIISSCIYNKLFYKRYDDKYLLRVLNVCLHEHIEPLVLSELPISVLADRPQVMVMVRFRIHFGTAYLRYCFLISELLFSSFFFGLFIKNQLIATSISLLWGCLQLLPWVCLYVGQLDEFLEI